MDIGQVTETISMIEEQNFDIRTIPWEFHFWVYRSDINKRLQIKFMIR